MGWRRRRDLVAGSANRLGVPGEGEDGQTKTRNNVSVEMVPKLRG